jgi:cytochrome c biogenesis factor
LGALQAEFEIRAGESVRWAGRTIRFAGLERTPQADKTVVAARLVVTDALGRDETLRPAQHYHHLQEIWTTEAAVQSLIAGDFYAVVRHGEANNARFLFLWNPLIWCVWGGGWMIGAAGLLGVVSGCLGRKRGRVGVLAGRSHLVEGGERGNHMGCGVPSIGALSTPAREGAARTRVRR